MMQRAVHHVRIQMTGGAGGDLDGGHAFGANTCRVIFGFEIALDDRDTEFVPECLDRCFQQQGFARPRRRHQIERQHAVAVEVFAVVRRFAVIGAEQALQNRDGILALRVFLTRQMFITGSDMTATSVAHRTSEFGMWSVECGKKTSKSYYNSAS